MLPRREFVNACAPVPVFMIRQITTDTRAKPALLSLKISHGTKATYFVCTRTSNDASYSSPHGLILTLLSLMTIREIVGIECINLHEHIVGKGKLKCADEANPCKFEFLLGNFL